MTYLRKATLVVVASLALAACASSGPEMETVDYVDLERFMGDWYVIANIPTFLEKDAYNAVENYEMNDDGTIATTFTFRKGGFDGEKKVYTPKGFVRDDASNALWGMRFIWPIKADYRIVYLDDDYSQTIIGRQKRDFVWVMAREPNISEADYEMLLDVVESLGYDMSKVQRVPQKW
jgi:apolipoprotein D and lipocalin family protein